jgi:hypothetical protein
MIKKKHKLKRDYMMGILVHTFRRIGIKVKNAQETVVLALFVVKKDYFGEVNIFQFFTQIRVQS